MKTCSHESCLDASVFRKKIFDAYKTKKLILTDAIQPYGRKRRNKNILRTKILNFDKRSGSIVRSNMKGHV